MNVRYGTIIPITVGVELGYLGFWCGFGDLKILQSVCPSKKRPCMKMTLWNFGRMMSGYSKKTLHVMAINDTRRMKPPRRVIILGLVPDPVDRTRAISAYRESGLLCSAKAFPYGPNGNHVG